MSDLGRGIDYSIQLVPVPAPAQRPRRRIVWGLLVAFAVMLSLGAIVAVVMRVSSTVQARGEVRVAAQRPPAIERAEAIAVFDKFDAVEDRRAQRSGTAPPWRESVAALFQKLQTCSEAKDLAGFQALVDLDRLLERVDRTGALAGWETLDKRFLRSEFHDSIDLSPFWNQITIAGVPDLTVNFDNQPDGFTNRINFLQGAITGDILVQSRAINFSSPGSLTFSFDSNISAWGTDIRSIGGPGLINFSVNGLSAIALINFTSPAFIGFYFPAFGASQFNVAFSPLPGGPANVSFLIDNVVATS
jgi:hypothetical protein